MGTLLLKSTGYGWAIEAHRGDESPSLMKSRNAAQDAGEPLQAVRLVRLMEKSEATMTASNRFEPMGAPGYVKLWLSRTAKQELRDRVLKAMQAETIPQDSLIRLDAGSLNVELVKSVLGISDYDPDDAAEHTEEASSILSKAYQAHAGDLKKAGGSRADLKAAATELDALVEMLENNRRDSR